MTSNCFVALSAGEIIVMLAKASRPNIDSPCALLQSYSRLSTRLFKIIQIEANMKIPSKPRLLDLSDLAPFCKKVAWSPWVCPGCSLQALLTWFSIEALLKKFSSQAYTNRKISSTQRLKVWVNWLTGLSPQGLDARQRQGSHPYPADLPGRLCLYMKQPLSWCSQIISVGSGPWCWQQ